MSKDEILNRTQSWMDLYWLPDIFEFENNFSIYECEDGNFLGYNLKQYKTWILLSGPGRYLDYGSNFGGTFNPCPETEPWYQQAPICKVDGTVTTTVTTTTTVKTTTTHDPCSVCDKNAYCEAGTCNCNTGYTGDGIYCETDPCSSCDKNAYCEAGTCYCNTGYTGDGIYCEADPCSSCDKNAYCEAGTCYCNTGYTGDGIYCEADPCSSCVGSERLFFFLEIFSCKIFVFSSCMVKNFFFDF